MDTTVGALARAVGLPIASRPPWIRWLSLHQLKTVEAATGVSSEAVHGVSERRNDEDKPSLRMPWLVRDYEGIAEQSIGDGAAGGVDEVQHLVDVDAGGDDHVLLRHPHQV